MKAVNEFFERLQNDETFAQEVTEKIKAKAEAGVQDYKELWIPVAAEYGYELSGEELDECYAAASAEMSEEELGKVAGGSTPGCIIVGGTIAWSVVVSSRVVINELFKSIHC